ncbi:MAG: haloacid dehalogenase [unclassified Hahellaceae]|nr:haloacid dehalogenase [Hahellaceae bacterium]
MKLKGLCVISAFAGCTLGLSATTLAAETFCSDYEAVQSAPTLNKPAQRNFRNWGNRYLSWAHRPFHMVHDQIVQEGKAATIVGKFDYSSVLHKDLENEDVHVYLYGTGSQRWEYLGEHRTNGDGKISVQVQKPQGDYVVRMVVEGDHSEALGYLTVVGDGRKAVLFDIDGTLTLSDFEGVGDYLGIDNADMHNYADEVVWEYVSKGYQIVYLTGRGYWQAKTTRDWFNRNGLFGWHLRTDANQDNPIKPNTQQYKTDYINYLKNEVGLDIIRAYGNADTDVRAYAAAGIPASETYIIGEHAGMDGTNAVDGDYALHYVEVAQPSPEAGCTWR